MPQQTPQIMERLARHAADALNRADLEGYLALMHPDVEFTSLIAEAEGDVFRGHEGVRRWWEEVRGAFEQVEWDFQEVRPQQDRGVAKIRIHGTLSGVEVEQTMWQAFRARDGKALWWRFFRSEDEAVEAIRPGGTAER